MGRPEHTNGARAIIREVFGEHHEERQIKRLEEYFKKLQSHKPPIVETRKEPMSRAGSHKDFKVVRWAAPDARMLFKNLVLLDALVSDYDLVTALVVEQGNKAHAALDKRLETSFRDYSRRFDVCRTWLNLVDPLREALRSRSLDLRQDFLEDVIRPDRREIRSGASGSTLAGTTSLRRLLEVIEAEERDSASDADNPQRLARLSAAQLELGNLTVAERQAERAIAINPTEALAWRTLALVELQRGAAARREATIQHLLAIDDTEPLSAEEQWRHERSDEAAERSERHAHTGLERLLRAYHLWPPVLPHWHPRLYDQDLRQEVVEHALLTALGFVEFWYVGLEDISSAQIREDLIALCRILVESPLEVSLAARVSVRGLQLQVATAELSVALRDRPLIDAYRDAWRNLIALYAERPENLLQWLEGESRFNELLLTRSGLSAHETTAFLDELGQAALTSSRIREKRCALAAYGQEARELYDRATFREDEEFAWRWEMTEAHSAEARGKPASGHGPAFFSQLHECIERALTLVGEPAGDAEHLIKEYADWRYKRLLALYLEVETLLDIDPSQAVDLLVEYLADHGSELEFLLAHVGTYMHAEADEFNEYYVDSLGTSKDDLLAPRNGNEAAPLLVLVDKIIAADCGDKNRSMLSEWRARLVQSVGQGG